MTLITSTHFASIAVSGTDWRDTSKKALEELELAIADDQNFSLGFLYISDQLAQDAVSILNLFRSVTNIDHWVGCVGLGVCGSDGAHFDTPAISSMIARIDPGKFHLFSGEDIGSDDSLKSWLAANDPFLTLVHGNPATDRDPADLLADLERNAGGFLVGGLCSSRTENMLFADDVSEETISGTMFSQDVQVATSLSQGCVPIGPVRTITRCDDDHVILELDNQRAFEVFTQDLRSMAVKRTGQDPDEIMVDEDAVEDLEKMPVEFRKLFRGEVHIAFPVQGSDRQDYLVRNIIGVDPDHGHMAVAQPVSSGERVVFVHRDAESVRADLSRTLVDLRERVTRDQGSFDPKGAIYISCVARADMDGSAAEIDLIREIIGEVPLTGFYAGGEISGSRLYGYSGVLVIFL